MNHNELSIKITKSISKEEKKNNGIYFTPKNIRTSIIDKLKKYLDFNKTYDIVEPSCGSCEFIDDILLDKSIKCNIIGIEKNKKICDILEKEYKNKDKIKLLNKDFLYYETKNDIYIGNPPYFVMKKENLEQFEKYKEYKKYFSGRPNIFVLFIIHSLELLNNDGFLCFDIPTSFLNSQYYNLLRKYIYEKFIIHEIDIYDDDINYFAETKQKTLGIIIQKKLENNKDHNNKYVKIFDDNYIFFSCDRKAKIDELLVNTTTLKEMKAKVKIGSVVWNQKIDKLTDDDNKKILVYNSNIVKKKFQYKKFNDKKKKQYIDIDDKNTFYDKSIIVINRGRGNADYDFEYCLLDKTIDNKQYVVENHLVMVLASKEKLEKIIKSFQNEKTKEFLKLFCGNNGLSKTEIEIILPIYL
jgi:predicted RNA methylase